VFRTSTATLAIGEGAPDSFRLEDVNGVAITPALATGHKCARCWRVLDEVKPPVMLCERCEDAVALWDKAHG
jgi:isoleucyl-tRNA synthetase